MFKAQSYLFPLFLLLITSCSFQDRRTEPVKLENDLEQIRTRGKLVVLTDYSSTDYFIYRGQPMGFQYEMLQQLANHLAVRLEVQVSRSLEESFEMLRSGEADLIAQNLTVTIGRLDFMDFTTPFIQSRQVLVQRKPENWVKMKENELKGKLVSSPTGLKNKTLYVVKGSAYVSRIQHLSEEIGGEIRLFEVDKSAEKLIEQVAEGDIPFTVCDEITAKVNSRYYPNLDFSTPVSVKQDLAWGVRKGSTTFVQALNQWLEGFTQSKKYHNIYSRYFESNRSATIVESDFYAINTGKISPFDDYIRKYSSDLGWDWRLVASLIYQESRFKTNVTSWKGAWGLMQLMPVTARRFGVDTISSARDQIRAGTQFIKWLNKHYNDIGDPEERIKFVLAAYNVGPGHVDDARNLAGKNGADPDKWDDNVAVFLLNKSEPQYYNDPVVKHGYCRGTETFNYVTQVLERYEHYKNIVAE